jgi:hypothetical protein
MSEMATMIERYQDQEPSSLSASLMDATEAIVVLLL